MVSGAVPGQYLYPLGNRLQSGVQVATTMIRLATSSSFPSPLTTAVSGTPGLGVRLASPASLASPRVMSPLAPPGGQPGAPQPGLLSPPPGGMSSPLRPGISGSPHHSQPPPSTPGAPGPMRGSRGPRPRGMVRM